MRVILLAAGFATRMYPLTRDFPKPLLEVGGKPILTHLLERALRIRGLREVIVVTNGRFAARIQAWADAQACPVPLRVEDDGAVENETRAGALKDLQLALQGSAAMSRDDVMVVAGDNLIDFELEDLRRDFERHHDPLLVIRRIDGPVPSRKHGEVTLAEDGVIRAFREKPSDPRSPLTATAIYVFPSAVDGWLREFLDGGGNPDAPGYFLEWLVPRVRVRTRMLPGRWFDIGDVESLEAARRAW